MNCCAPYLSRLNPITGEIVVYNTETGAIVTDAAILARLTCCPTRQTDKEKACLQPTGNTDPALVVPGWQISVFEVASDGTLEVLSTTLYDDSLATDLTATHEVTACPDDTPIDTPLCDPGA